MASSKNDVKERKTSISLEGYMIEIKNKELCTGCYGCMSICPKHCISMESDNEGFWYPVVDKKECIDCGFCENVCPVLHKIELNGIPVAYAAINKNETIRIESSSGGIFTLIAENILDSGGVVFGAAFDDDFNVIHTCVETKENLHNLRGSKYVQSKIGDSYNLAKAYLQEGRKVLFTGTPCQISGLKSLIGYDYDNLFCQDIICHGVPSPIVWEKYVKYQENKNKSKITDISFRNKKMGWKKFSLLLNFKNGTEYSDTINHELYLSAFNNSLFLRPSCYSCSFKTLQRQADITLADFWGISNINKELDDDKGTSLLIIHTEKGKKVLNSIKDKLECSEVNIKDAINNNPAMIKSMIIHKNRKLFFKKLNRSEINALIKKYNKRKLVIRIRNNIKLAIKELLIRLKLFEIIRDAVH